MHRGGRQLAVVGQRLRQGATHTVGDSHIAGDDEAVAVADERQPVIAADVEDAAGGSQAFGLLGNQAMHAFKQPLAHAELGRLHSAHVVSIADFALLHNLSLGHRPARGEGEAGSALEFHIPTQPPPPTLAVGHRPSQALLRTTNATNPPQHNPRAFCVWYGAYRPNLCPQPVACHL